MNYIKSLPANQQLTLPQLSQKFLSLMALVSAQRTQTLVCLDISSSSVMDDHAVFYMTDLQKTTSTKNSLKSQTIEFSSYPHDVNICVITTLHEYIKCTTPLRDENKETRHLYKETIQACNHRNISSLDERYVAFIRN